MANKNETPIAIFALLITFGLIGAGVWWLTQKSGLIGRLSQSGSNTPSAGVTSGQAGAGTFSQVQEVPSGVFNYGGSTSWAPVRGQVDPVIQSSFPQFQLRYTNPPAGAPSSGMGIRMLLDNQLSFAQSSRSLETQELQEAQQRGYTLVEIPVALEGIAIAVHPTLNIPGVTIDQLRGIYTGQITNWSQVGGPNLPIVPYSRRPDGGTVEFFISNVLGGQNFGSNVRLIGTTTEALRQVSNNPGALYFASAPEVVGQCTTKPLPLGLRAGELIPPYREPLVPPSQCPAQRNQINEAALKNGQYPITRRLFVIVKQNGQVDQQAGQSYANLLLTEQGQQLLTQAGFVRIR